MCVPEIQSRAIGLTEDEGMEHRRTMPAVYYLW